MVTADDLTEWLRVTEDLAGDVSTIDYDAGIADLADIQVTASVARMALNRLAGAIMAEMVNRKIPIAPPTTQEE
jgi:hypothetical protein